MQYVILCGGRGERLGSLCDDIPKPMLPWQGRPFLEHVMHGLFLCGASEIVFCTGYKAECVEGYFGTCYKGRKLLYSQEPYALGTGGALRNAYSLLADAFVVVNGDTMVNVRYEMLLAELGDTSCDAALCVFRQDDLQAVGGVTLDPRNRVERFVEKPGALLAMDTYASTGACALRKTAVESLTLLQPTSLERDLYPQLADQRRMRAVVCEGGYADLGELYAHRA